MVLRSSIATASMLVSLLLIGCGGGGDSSTSTASSLSASSPSQAASTPSVLNPLPPPSPASGAASSPPALPAGQPAGMLAKGVHVLSATDEAALVNSSGTQVTFSTLVPLTIGEIYLGRTTTFVVTSVDTSGGRTVVQTSAPTVEQLFTQLAIKASVTAIDEVPKDAQAQRLRPAGTYSAPVTVASAGVELQAQLSGTFDTDVDYGFDVDKGGLLSSSFDVHATSTLDITRLRLKVATGYADEVVVKTLRIPIPVSIYDQALVLIGVRVVSVVVPISIGAFFTDTFEVNATGSVSASLQGGLKYSQATGITPTFRPSGSSTINGAGPSVPSGATPYASFNAIAGPTLRLRPALAFLDTVALLGVDTQFKLAGNYLLQATVPDVPHFCLTQKVDIDVAMFGFFKGVGKAYTTDSIDAHLFSSDPVYFGACRTPSRVGVSFNPPNPSYGQVLIATATVAPSPAAIFIPAAQPTSKVTVTLGTESCDLTLVQTATPASTGSCTLTAKPALVATPAGAVYSGDALYVPSSTSTTINVSRSGTVASLISATPVSPFAGQQVEFKVLVESRPIVAGSLAGTATIQDSSGRSKCTLIVSDDGSGRCTSTLSDVGIVSFTAAYVGNSNFLPSGSSALAVTVRESECVQLKYNANYVNVACFRNLDDANALRVAGVANFSAALYEKAYYVEVLSIGGGIGDYVASGFRNDAGRIVTSQTTYFSYPVDLGAQSDFGQSTLVGNRTNPLLPIDIIITVNIQNEILRSERGVGTRAGDGTSIKTDHLTCTRPPNNFRLLNFDNPPLPSQTIYDVAQGECVTLDEVLALGGKKLRDFMLPKLKPL